MYSKPYLGILASERRDPIPHVMMCFCDAVCPLENLTTTCTGFNHQNRVEQIKKTPGSGRHILLTKIYSEVQI